MALPPARILQRLLQADFTAFAHRAHLELYPGAPFRSNFPTEIIADALEDVRRGTTQRLIINVPPRHGKSFMTSVSFPAWIFGHEPSTKIIAVSHGQDLADKFARDSRMLMTSPFYQSVFPDARLSKTRDAVSEYETTAGGYRISTSIGGGLTGIGADLIIIDDPLKAADALSDVRRTAVNDWFDNTLRSRLNSQARGGIIIVTQRLHVDDIVAHVQQHETWHRVSLPAVAVKNERFEIRSPYGFRRIERHVGEALDKALFSVGDFERLRETMNEYNFAAQYQQDPQPLAGNIVKNDWIVYYDPSERPHYDKIIQAWDTANKDTEFADFSVCTTWGMNKKNMDLLDVYRRRVDFPELKRAVRAQADQHHADIILIEDQGSGTSLIQELRSERLLKVQPASGLVGDKRMRLMGQTAKIKEGYARFPRQAPWLEDYLSELLGFPNTRYFDQVDATVFALAWSTNNQPKELWTEQALNGLNNFYGGLVFEAMLRQGR